MKNIGWLCQIMVVFNCITNSTIVIEIDKVTLEWA